MEMSAPSKGEASLFWFRHRGEEGAALACQPLFKSRGAIAVVAGPALSAVEVAAAAPRVRVLDFQEVEIYFPVGTLFLKRRGTVADLNPLSASILELPGFSHISKIFASGDRPPAQRSVVD